MIIDSKEWKLITQEIRMQKGKLVNIDLGKGRFVKMYEADAIAQGYAVPSIEEIEMQSAAAAPENMALNAAPEAK
jgi:hypothetical protein